MISSLVKPENVVCQLESTDKDSLFAELTEVLEVILLLIEMKFLLLFLKRKSRGIQL